MSNSQILLSYIGRGSKCAIKGDTATFIPSHFPCWRVSEIVIANSGPGEIPAVRPRNAPKAKNSIKSTIIKYYASVFHISLNNGDSGPPMQLARKRGCISVSKSYLGYSILINLILRKRKPGLSSFDSRKKNCPDRADKG